MVLLQRLAKDFQGGILSIPGRAIEFFFVLFLICLPLMFSNPYLIKIFIFANIFAIFAASWDLLSGFTGQMSLGHAAFFGIGAYTAALLNIKAGLPPWITIPCGSFMSVLMGLVIGFPALRIRGVYLALVTLAFPILLNGVVQAFPEFTGGELGIYGVSPLSDSDMVVYYLTLFLMTASALLMWKFTDIKSSTIRLGAMLSAIREDEITARASGVNTTKYKLIAFCISAFFAGFAGGLYSHVMRIAGPSVLDLFFTFQPIIWTIFGGVATIGGAVAGVYILFPLMEFLRIVPETRMLIFALVIVIVLFFMPEGLTTRIRDKILEEECPRCKLLNAKYRRYCRACDADLHPEKRSS